MEILTGEGKSCVIAMVAATYALQERTVDIVTSSPVLSQRDAEEWREFHSLMKLKVGCNVDDNTKKDTTCYDYPIVYGTVETFARDILRTEFFLQDVRKCRTCDIVIVDEVDSMLIDQGVQCTYLSHDVVSNGLCHFKPILAMIWMHVGRLTPFISKEGILFYVTEPEDCLVVLSRLRNEIDPLQILRLAEDDEEVPNIKKGFTDEYLSKDFEGRWRLLEWISPFPLFMFARKVLHLNIDIYNINFISDFDLKIDRSQISIVSVERGLASVVFHGDVIKDRLTKMILDENETKIDLPIHLKDYCSIRLRCWIDNAFLAKDMRPWREYIVQEDTIYPVDYKSTGVIETNKKWGDGLQQFLEMKHGLPRSPLSLITNYLSNIDFFDRYGSNIVGVTGTLGDEQEKQFMRDTFLVEFATIPTSKRRKLVELDGLILEEFIWQYVVSEKVVSTAYQRAVLVICEDIETAEKTYGMISKEARKVTLYSRIKSEGDRMNMVLKPGDIVITTNLGARGTNFETDDVVNKNGGLFVLVTFIPLNDRVEKQAFGRTGRRGATGSCQIIANRLALPEWARQCETIDEVRRLRDSIESNRLDKNDTTEVTWIRCKQKLFREYCKFKNEFVTSNASESNDLKIQTEILDQTWAKWIEQYETMDHESNHVEMVQELHRILEDCSRRIKTFDFDNIYYILKFGAVRLMKDAFEGAAEFYDRVIRKDPDWSAFAHYNRAYCTIQMKSDGYIQHAIDDLNAALCKLEKYKTNCLFSQITGRMKKDKRKSKDRKSDISAQYYTMIECQLLHHIATQINETIDKMKQIDPMNGTVIPVRRNILELIPGADCRMEQMLQEYRQLGLLFTYNIDVEPQFCYRSQIVSSLVMLKSVADIILTVFFNGVLLKALSVELKDAIDAACSIVATSDESFGWMSRCVSKAINTGINLNDFIQDVSSHLVPIKRTDLESSNKTTKETSQFTQLANSQELYVLKLLNSLKPKMNKLVSCQVDEILLHMTNVTMGALREKIEHEKIAHGQNLNLKLCSLYNNVSSPSRSDLEQFRDLAKFSASPSQLSDADFQTDELQNIALKLMSMSRNDSITATDLESYSPEITTAASKIEIGTVMTKFSDFLCDMMNVFSQKSTTDGNVCDDVQMLEATNEVLTLAWSEIIRGMLQNRIVRSLLIDIRKEKKELFELESKSLFELMGYNPSIQFTLNKLKSHIIRTKQEQRSSNRLSKFINQMRKSRDPHLRSKVDARMICKRHARDIIILDVDRETILTIPSYVDRDSIKLIYNPPCPVYPGGHFDAYVRGEVVRAPSEDTGDYDLFHSAVRAASGDIYVGRWQFETYIDEHPSVVGRLLTSGEHAYQLKRGRALLRLDMNHPTRQMNQCESVELDSSHLSSCIEQALKSENVSQLAKVLTECESRLISAETTSPENGTEVMTSSVLCDACKLFLSSENSAEAKVYRQLVVERINDGDITTALKLCYIGHQISFCRDKMNINLPISDAQTLSNTSEQMLKIESYEQEISKFLSICDEWFRVLEPQGMMNIQRDLLREWISTRQYANTEDPIVSLVIEKCSKPKKEEEERKWREAKKRRNEIMEKMRDEIKKKMEMDKKAERKLQDANYSDDSWSSSDASEVEPS